MKRTDAPPNCVHLKSETDCLAPHQSLWTQAGLCTCFSYLLRVGSFQLFSCVWKKAVPLLCTHRPDLMRNGSTALLENRTGWTAAAGCLSPPCCVRSAAPGSAHPADWMLLGSFIKKRGRSKHRNSRPRPGPSLMRSHRAVAGF